MLRGTVSPLFVITFLTYYWEYDIVGGVPGQENRSTLIYMRQNLKKTFVCREKVIDIDITYTIKDIKFISGDANVATVRGKKRYIFDFIIRCVYILY